MPADPPDTDPTEQDPRERALRRRSRSPALGPWLAVVLVGLLALAVYAASALI